MPHQRFQRLDSRSVIVTLIATCILINLNKLKNHIVENAGVAFVKGTHERNEFFEKINKQ